MCFSFSMIFSFLAICQVLQCVFLIYHDFQFSINIPGPTLFISHFSRFSVFLGYFMSYRVFCSFLMIFSFLTIIQVLQCAFLIFHGLQCFFPYFNCNSVCFSFLMIFSFLANFRSCISHILFSQCCSPYCMFYIVFLIFHYFQISHHTPSPIVSISHYSGIWVFLPIL